MRKQISSKSTVRLISSTDDIPVPAGQRSKPEGRAKRPGSKPKLDAKQAAMVTALACSKAPDGHEHWTLRMPGSPENGLGLSQGL